VTVSVTVVECVASPLVPVTVIGYVPVATPESTAIVIVEEPPPLGDAGSKLTATPLGWPLALRPTGWLVPLVTAVEIVDVPLCPCATSTLAGLAASEKSNGAVLQPASVNDPIRVCQLNVPLVARYSDVYQSVQSSAGSTLRLE
jgi:hypothetical protein